MYPANSLVQILISSDHSRRLTAAASAIRLKWLALLLALAFIAGGCASLPSPEDIRATDATVAGPGQPGADARARLRTIFCDLARQRQLSAATDDPTCDGWLWRLADEPAPANLPLPALDPQLQVFVVGGAFSDCFGEASLAYRDGLQQLVRAGVNARAVAISSRSSAGHNAAMLASALTEAAPPPDARVVLIGYSKGAVDILQFLAEYPDLARQVDAVVSVAGPVLGSEVARKGAWVYDTFLSHAFAGRCDPGDGGVIDSLQPGMRQQWLAEHPLPDTVQYYSLLAFTTREHLARGLKASWDMLAEVDRRNDGQVAPAEGIIPGATLLGFANADHWGVAIDIEEELTFLAHRPDPTPFPRDVLLEAILRLVSADFATANLSMDKGT